MRKAVKQTAATPAFPSLQPVILSGRLETLGHMKTFYLLCPEQCRTLPAQSFFQALTAWARARRVQLYFYPLFAS